MKVLVDTNVVLDVLLRRSPFYQDSFTIFQNKKDYETTDIYCLSPAEFIIYTKETN